jgi:LruC domain-containing protein
MNRLYLLLFSAFAAAAFVGCSKPTLTEDDIAQQTPFFAPDGFKYETTRDVAVQIRTQDREGRPLRSVEYKLFLDPSDESSVVARGWTNEMGTADFTVSVAMWISSLSLATEYIGFPGLETRTITSDRVMFTGRVASGFALGKASFLAPAETVGLTLSTLGPWSSNGLPSYLTPEPFPVDPQLLESLNATLPEGVSLPLNNPGLLGNRAANGTQITEEADVWVSFIHEGAGWQNVLGFFTFPTGEPPTSISQIQNATVIFPKVSYSTLSSGDRVHIGHFSPGETIGWFVIANGWSKGTSGKGDQIYFSVPALNPEVDPEMQQHHVLLDDPSRQVLLLAFEDERRDRKQVNGDDDFNDLVFTISATPDAVVRSVSLPSVVVVPPEQPTRTYSTELFYPSSGGVGTLAYEDLWPGLGDYDFNDLVVNYQYTVRLDNANEVIELIANMNVQAIGAGFHNGLALALPLSAAAVDRVSGNRTNGLMSLRPNGVESGPSNAIIPLFDDAFSLAAGGSGYFVNTQHEAPVTSTDPVSVSVMFKKGVRLADLGSAPFDPFLIANRNRGVEIHLPGNQPTAMADWSLFQSLADNSIPSSGQTYLTSDNLPWAIQVPSPFAYPAEKFGLTKAHPRFTDWAKSGGTLYTDWFLNKEGYRASQFIY